MRKAIKILFTFIILALLSTSICMATDVNNAPTTGSSKSTVHNDLFMANSTATTVEDIVEGNAFIYGTDVTIKGEIRGDLFVAANSVTIDKSAVVTGNLFVYGSEVNIKGSVNNVYGFSAKFNIENGGRVNRDINVFANELHLEGYVARNVNAYVSSIVLPENAQNVIGGNLNYSASSDQNIPQEAVNGDIKYTASNTTPTNEEIISSYVSNLLTVLAYAFVVIFIAAFFMPNFKDKVSYALEKRPFVTAGIGILSIVVIPILAVIFIISGILAYAGIALIGVYALVLSISISILSIAVGNYLTNKCKNKTKGKFILLSLLSVIVIWLLQLIPVFGGWMSLFTYVFGLGLFVFAFFTKKNVNDLNGQNATATSTTTTTTVEQPKADGEQK